MNAIGFLESLRSDLLYAGRAMRHNVTFTVVVVLTLAVGIGANTAVFSVVNSVLLRPLPYPQAERLVALRQIAPGVAGSGSSADGLRLSPSMYITYAEQNRTFESLGVWTTTISTVTGVGEPEQVRVVLVSDGVVQALGVPPAAGRWLTAMEAISLHSDGERWCVTTGQGDVFARAVVIATGTTLKTLGIPGEEQLRGKGVSHCASCDAPLLRGRIVGVVGGGDSALQEALTLAQHAARVLIIHRSTAFTAQAAYIQQVRENPKIEVRFSTVVEEAVGNGALTGVRTRHVNDGKTEHEPRTGTGKAGRHTHGHMGLRLRALRNVGGQAGF